jgi:hypothetical protein
MICQCQNELNVTISRTELPSGFTLTRHAPEVTRSVPTRLVEVDEPRQHGSNARDLLLAIHVHVVRND